jgi:hypothetical protein
MTSTATTSNPFPDVSPRPDTTYLPDPWFDEDGERRFWGTDRDGVMISGYQKADGHVRARWIELDHQLGEMSEAEARSEGVRLIAAADELKRLATRDQIEAQR